MDVVDVPSGNLTQLMNMAIEIVSISSKTCDFPVCNVTVYQRVVEICSEQMSQENK